MAETDEEDMEIDEEPEIEEQEVFSKTMKKIEILEKLKKSKNKQKEAKFKLRPTKDMNQNKRNLN